MRKVYACADFHGNWELAEKILNYIKSDDTLYFLGDAVDRAPDGIKIFQTLINDPRVKFIRGNHEEMMADAIPYIAKEVEDGGYYGGNGYILWYGNGGEVTAKALRDMNVQDIYAIREVILKMPTELIYESPLGHKVILEHAGYSPFITPHRQHNPVWDRDHFYDDWNDGYKKEDFNPDNTYLIHGHTPVQYLKYLYGYKNQPPFTEEEIIQKRKWLTEAIEDKKPEVIKYCDGHKFDIDLCTIISNRIALIDLDTFEIIYFDEDKGDKN